MKKLISVSLMLGLVVPGVAMAQSAEQQLTLCRDLYQVTNTMRNQAEVQAAQLKGERDALKTELDIIVQKTEKKELKEKKTQ